MTQEQINTWQNPGGRNSAVVLAAMIHFSEEGLFKAALNALSVALGIPKTSLSTSMKKLREAGCIKCEWAGTSSKPSHYRILKNTDEGVIARSAWYQGRSEWLAANYADGEPDDILTALNAMPGTRLTQRSIKDQASKMKLWKSAAYMERVNAAGVRTMNVTRLGDRAPAIVHPQAKIIPDAAEIELIHLWTETQDTAKSIAEAINAKYGLDLTDNQIRWRMKRIGANRPDADADVNRTLAALEAPRGRREDKVRYVAPGSFRVPPGGFRMGMGHE